MPDAITLLKSDHAAVETLFKQFEAAGDKAYKAKKKLVDKIIKELSIHAAVEEMVFYPATRELSSAVEDHVLESLEEHHVVKWLLSELVDMDPAHERFDAKVTVLIENVRHHVEEEESDFFPKVREQLGRKELTDLGETLADAKKSAPTRPHPRLPDAGPANVVAGAITGVVDRVGDNLSGLAQGSVSAVQDFIARITGADRPKVSPTGSSITRTRAKGVRSSAATAIDGVQETARSAKSGATSTARAAKAGAKGTATSAGKSARATATTAKRASTTTGRTARSATKTTAATAKRTASKTKAAAFGSR